MKINEIIQSKRKELNMTQMQLAERLDVSDKTISRWELGTIYPNIDMIPKIASVLGIGINELFGDTATTNEVININEKCDYKKIALLKIFLFVLVGTAILSAILFFSGIKESETNSKLSATLIIISIIIFLLSSITFFTNRYLYSVFYKEKFYIDEYKYYDGKLTTIAIFINCIMIGDIFVFAPNFLFLSILIFTVLSIINFYFLRHLGYIYGRRALAPLILTSILYLIFLFFAIISLFSHILVLIIPYMFAYFTMCCLACLSLLLFIKQN